MWIWNQPDQNTDIIPQARGNVGLGFLDKISSFLQHSAEDFRLQVAAGADRIDKKGGGRDENTSLCYLERGGQYLMLHRVKKENDENHDKWIGVGGKFEPGESPEDCVCREVRRKRGWRLRTIATAALSHS